ncbi:uncharacterized protein RG961_007465 [Leptosomus discolor]
MFGASACRPTHPRCISHSPWWRCQQLGSHCSVPGTSLIMSLVSSSSTRQREAFEFLLYKSVPGHGEIFQEVSESELQPGDIVLFPLDNSWGKVIRGFMHAAVYCGDGEVIHFQYTNTGTTSGLISKEGFKAMKKKRGKFEIYRKKGGINLSDFRQKVREVMECEANYDLGTNNCIHFALYLLGLVDFYKQLVVIKKEGGSSGSWALYPLPQ